MKKNYLIYFVILAFVTITFTNCKKYEATKPDNKVQLTSYNLQINQMITGFKAKLASKLKSGETMSFDSALWYINITLNGTYAVLSNGNLQPGKTYFDSLTITLPVVAGGLNIEQINNLYNKITDSARVVYHRISDPDKQLAAIIFDPRGNENSIELKIKMLTYSTWGLQYWERFGESETYYYGYVDENGNHYNPCAAGKFNEKFALHVSPYMPAPGYFWIPAFTKFVIQPEEFPYNWQAGTHTNYLEYYLFTSYFYFPGYHTWLCADELNFYMSKAIELADVIIPQQNNFEVSENFRCYQINVGSCMGFCGNSLVEINHSINFYYGWREIIGQWDPLEL